MISRDWRDSGVKQLILTHFRCTGLARPRRFGASLTYTSSKLSPGP